MGAKQSWGRRDFRVEPALLERDDVRMPATTPLPCTGLSSFRKRLLTFGVAAALAAGSIVFAAKSGDRAPELVSRTGGGGALWSSVAELKEAAKAGNPKAMAVLGDLQLVGDQVEKNVQGALDLLRAAAKKGEASAVFRLAKLYDEGGVLPLDRPRALAYFRAAAAGGVPEAFYNLGATYSSGRGVKRDYSEGLAWMILASQAGLQTEGEKQLRARIESLRRPDWIQSAQRRAPELSKELAGKSVIEWLAMADAPASSLVAPPPIVSPVAPQVVPPTSQVAPPALAPALPAPGLPRPDGIQLPEVVTPKPNTP